MARAGDEHESASDAGDGARAFERGDQLASEGTLDRAEQAYREADEAGHSTAAAKRGLLLEHRGKAEEAFDAYQRADEREDRLGAFRLGLMLAARDEWDDATAAWARADTRGTEVPGLDLEALLREHEQRASGRSAGEPRSALANPVLVGAVTLLVSMVAVFLSYNANEGLPFVPTRELKVDIASGSDLVPGNEVSEGGYRIGLVSELVPIQLPSGQVGAQLTLKLNTSHGRVPVDSTAEIRPRSVLGLKFVDLHFGSARKVFSDGGTMPIGQTSVPVQFEDVFQTFNGKTRRAIDRDLVGFGDTLAARGSALNDTIAALPGLLGHLRPVAQYLSDRGTGLTPFFDSLEGFMGTVAPVAQTNARLFTDMATTFEAISRDPNALERTIAESPSTEQVSTASLKVQQPFLVDLSTLGRKLTPATAELKSALPTINPAIEAGTSTLARTPSLNAHLQQVMAALKNLARAPGTNMGINALSATVATLNPMIRYLGPVQTVCDGWNYFWTFLSEHISEATSFGFAQRALLNMGNPTQANQVGQQGATQPVNGGGSDSMLTGGNAYLHSQNYGAAVTTSGAADCETGQRGYPKRLNASDPLHRDLALDAHTPGVQGPTFKGRARVPAGETFSRNPTTGPQLAANPSNP